MCLLRLSRAVLSRFKNYEISGGSIGIWAARLWKREVSGLLIDKAWETPWDANPIIGISRKLGYAFLRPTGSGWELFNPLPVTTTYHRDHDLLIVHHKDTHPGDTGQDLGEGSANLVDAAYHG